MCADEKLVAKPAARSRRHSSARPPLSVEARLVPSPSICGPAPRASRPFSRLARQSRRVRVAPPFTGGSRCRWFPKRHPFPSPAPAKITPAINTRGEYPCPSSQAYEGESMSTGAASSSLGGRGLGPDIRKRASARFLSRWFTRAESSVLPPSYTPLVTRHCINLPETVTRVETNLTHRKQTTAHRSTRNVPAHGNFRSAFAATSLRSTPRFCAQPSAVPGLRLTSLHDWVKNFKVVGEAAIGPSIRLPLCWLQTELHTQERDLPS